MTENAANLELAADIASAYVSNNALPALDFPAFIHSVHGTLKYTTYKFGVKLRFSVYFKALYRVAGHVHTTYAW